MCCRAVEKRVFGEHPIALIHQFQRLGIHTNRRVIQRRPADLQQLALLGEAEIRAIPVDHRLAFGRAHLGVFSLENVTCLQPL